MVGKLEALPRSQTEDSPLRERVVEEFDHLTLQKTIEIDQHIAADHQGHLCKNTVGDQVVGRKTMFFFNASINLADSLFVV